MTNKPERPASVLKDKIANRFAHQMTRLFIVDEDGNELASSRYMGWHNVNYSAALPESVSPTTQFAKDYNAARDDLAIAMLDKSMMDPIGTGISVNVFGASLALQVTGYLDKNPHHKLMQEVVDMPWMVDDASG